MPEWPALRRRHLKPKRDFRCPPSPTAVHKIWLLSPSLSAEPRPHVLSPPQLLLSALLFLLEQKASVHPGPSNEQRCRSVLLRKRPQTSVVCAENNGRRRPKIFSAPSRRSPSRSRVSRVSRPTQRTHRMPHVKAFPRCS